MSTAPRFLTVVIQLPEDPASRRAIAEDLQLFRDYKGGKVTAVYAGDAISENEQMEALIPCSATHAIREQVNAGSPPMMTLKA